jgi:hypothetical protein
MSCGFCSECHLVGAIPYFLLVANTAAVGGLEHAAQWWVQTVEFTLDYLDKPREAFENDVRRVLQQEAEEMAILAMQPPPEPGPPTGFPSDPGDPWE